MKDKTKLIEQFFEKGILLSKDLLEKELLEEGEDNLVGLNNHGNEEGPLVLQQEFSSIVDQKINWKKLDNLRVKFEKGNDLRSYQEEIKSLNNFKFSEEKKLEEVEVKGGGNLEILYSYAAEPKKYTIKDFTKLFISRYKYLENLLRHRQELSGVLSIERVINKKEKDKVAVIGLIVEINETRNNNLIIVIEDLTGRINLLVSGNKKELFKQAKDLVPDEVVGVVGNSGDKIIFVDTIVWPEIPVNNELKRLEEEEYAVFLSDVHIGSMDFLEEEFNKFLKWISGEVGTDKQKAIAKKIKYLFVIGDLVDGVGIYPNQDKELVIKDIYGQYEESARLLKKIPPHVQIVICPGNHDAVHLAEPQPAFDDTYVKSLLEMPNVKLVSNPAMITIGKRENSEGMNVLMYHGYSFDYYVANVDSIRFGGGYNRADLIMKFLLKRRHLAPAFTSTPYFPSYQEDPLLIKKIPDFFVTGHIHYSVATNYRGVTLISGSCWQKKTSFQEKLGHEPEPARVPIVNLKTREIKILKFI
jgi:DNA polymerase II small subunit